MDNINPYDLHVDWDAPFDFCDAGLQVKLIKRLDIARAQIKNLRNMDSFYNKKGRTLTTSVHVLTQQLKAFLSHLGEAAYLNASGFCKSGHPFVQKGRGKVCDNIEKACRHLSRLVMDLLKCELYAIIRYFDNNSRFDKVQRMELLSSAIQARAADHAPVCFNETSRELEICEDTFKRHYEIYKTAVERLYEYADYDPTVRY